MKKEEKAMCYLWGRSKGFSFYTKNIEKWKQKITKNQNENKETNESGDLK